MAELTGKQVRLVRVAPAHVDELRRILHTEEVARRWGTTEDADPDWPFEDPGLVRFAVLLPDGTVAGLVQYGEELDPMYRHASVDVFLDPARTGRGLGRDAVRTVVRHLVTERGHHRITIDPAADNEPAIRCYTAVGFRPVGRLRRYERDTSTGEWHDGLLMDLLAEDFETGSAG